ncbi:hypothetical protein GCM10009716_38140 [Streptomyces sodiiphilus]|uniref:Rhodanese domain-containing protein n=1 Tax=Streptomyces sodiiphilus TaxID=226217 RepID=A0ABP5B1J5_9ACTN
MTPEVDLTTFAAAHAEGAFVVDVREVGEYTSGHVPGAVLMPLATVPAGIPELPRGRPVYVICASGNRSRSATDWMRSQGVDAHSVAGGTGAWARSGRPLETGRSQNVS